MKVNCPPVMAFANTFLKKRQRLLRITAWLNIIIQLAFPLAGIFTPVIAAEKNEQHFLAQSENMASLRTRPYTLTPGESVQSVAAHYNISLDWLRHLNQLRTFAHGFDHLQPGDELDVPLSPLPVVTWDDTVKKQPASPEETPDAGAHSMAGLASQTGSFLSGHPDGNAAASLARGMAIGTASSEFQQWLSRFGTAHVQFDMDKNFSLKNSSFDLLFPLWERPDRLFFVQGSLHRTDERTQTNLGLGLRTFQTRWMAGGNVFFDDDLSRYHYRMGLGLEYGRDYLKLSANHYLRLSGWQDAKILEDYEARPANGWDLRMETWLPAYPQLGGKLMYEQYYGSEVALFGTDHRQHNPRAITAGITWTPVPLVTFSAERKQGQSGKHDSWFGTELRFQPGVPWHQQFSPDVVSALRSLAGSRHDLVDRNNNIVLEYRKKESIRLSLSRLITGWSGEMKSLGVSVNSKYGLERINWDAPQLLAQGGKIVTDGAGGYNVVMPAWHYGEQGSNTYIIGGVAVDEKGNTSARTEAQVTVTQPVISATASTLMPLESTLPADGKAQQTLTLSLKDERDNPVDVSEDEITVSTSVNASNATGKAIPAAERGQPTISAFRQQSAGIYTAVVTAGTSLVQYSVTPSIRGMNVQTAVINLVSDSTALKPDQAKSSVKTDLTTYTPGDTIVVTVALKDSQGRPISDHAPLLATAMEVQGAVLRNSWQEKDNGLYSAIYTATTAATGLKAKLQIPGWNRSVDSTEYEIIELVMPKSLSVNGYKFGNNQDFPKTGFKGAQFTLNVHEGSAADYNWQSDAAWVTVSNGIVSFTGTGTSKKVTITGKPASGRGATVVYSFTLKDWYNNNNPKILTWSEAETYCKNLSGSLATARQLNGGDNYSNGKRGTIGTLWGEWGNLTAFSTAGFVGGEPGYWTSEKPTISVPGVGYYFIYLDSGRIESNYIHAQKNIVCRLPR